MRCLLMIVLFAVSLGVKAQINVERMMIMGRSALYYEDYVLAIQRFNRVVASKPYLAQPYFFRALAKFYLEDFIGANLDCSDNIRLAPYEPQGYLLRGLSRVNLKLYDKAAADYETVIKLSPGEQAAWHNLVLCRVNMKQYETAISALDSMVVLWPRKAEYQCMRAMVEFERHDTLSAEVFLNKALSINRYEEQAHSMLSTVSMQREEWTVAEQHLDTALIAAPRHCGYLVNRALARFHQRNLRGAMSDYDAAIEIDSTSYLAHFNRALLRTQVGDDNRAIEDFNFVLSIESDNDIALYNRALLYDNTGAWQAALADINAILSRNPYFWDGYLFRAQLKRKLGDRAGAERDEFKVMKEQMEVRSGQKRASVSKTRKRGSKNLADYNKIVEEESHAVESEYVSEWRGKVQNRYVEMKHLPRITDAIMADATADQRKVFALFNDGCDAAAKLLYDEAIAAFGKAIMLDPLMPEAYYNRGVTYILKGDRQHGLADLSQAGELGLYGAYNLIKRYAK